MMTKRLPAIFIAAFILASAVVYGIDRYLYRNVTHDPIPKLTQESFQSANLEVQPITDQYANHYISEFSVLKITDPAMKFYQGRVRNIDLVDTSRRVGPNASFIHVNASLTANDPHFRQSNNRWQNIPCYVVTIEDPARALPITGTKVGPPSQPPPNDIVIVAFVDATNGKILTQYQFENTNRG